MPKRKSERLRLSEVRAVFRLVGECQELGADPHAWRAHLAERLPGLVGSQVAMVGEVAASPDGVSPGRFRAIATAGWPSPQALAAWASYSSHEAYLQESLFGPIQARADGAVCSRDQVIDDRTWFNSAYYNETQRRCEVDELLVSFHDLPAPGWQNSIGLCRSLGGTVFRRPERQLVWLVQVEVARHCGATLATLADPSPADLTPRRREVLRCLLEGDSEKQVAARLGFSSLTVHDHVKALYRHFRVASRAELLAYFLRRAGFRLPGPDDRG